MSMVRVNDHAEVGNKKYVDTECVLYSNGLLVTSVVSRSKHWTEGLRARVFTVLYDSQDRMLWISKLNSCRTCGGRGDWTCPSARSDVFQEQLPEVVAQKISGIDVYEYDGEGRDWREQLVTNVKNAIATGQDVYDSVSPEVKTAIAAALV